ncbi:sigma-B regulation protein RsbQ [Lysinibacillus sp. TE18511]
MKVLLKFLKGVNAMIDVIVRNNVKIIGKGNQTIIFAHGFGCDQNMWRFITPAFEENFQVILFDYVGSGKSDLSAYKSEKYNTLHGYVQDILDIIDFLKLKEIIFVGHSISSMIGMLASIKRPESFKKLVMIGPSPCYLNDGAYHGGFELSDITELLDMMEMNFSGWASYLAPIAMKNPEIPSLSQELEQTFIAANPVIAREFAEVTFLSDYRDDLVKATVPSLIMQCSDDSIVPIEIGDFLHIHLTNSTLIVMEAKGHYPHISHPEETIRCIKAFL